MQPRTAPTSAASAGAGTLPARCAVFQAQGQPSKRRRVLCRSDGEPDFVTRVFGKVFGSKALEDRTPFGMKRMDQEEMYELYPAVLDEFAAPVEGDSATVALFRPLLARTRLEKQPLRLAYDANMHGWQARSFHARCDGYGAAVVLAKTSGGSLLGGYNPQGWIGLNEERDSNAAFLFAWPDGDTAQPAIKLPKVGGPNLAVIDGGTSGIQFGAEGLSIGLQAGRERQAKSRLGSYYAKHAGLPARGRSLFAPAEAGQKAAELSELQVFVADGAPEHWQLDGIVWKSSQGGG